MKKEKKKRGLRLPSKDLKEFKEKLLKLKDELSSQIKELSNETLMKSQKDISGDISGYSLHLADVASDNYEREFNLGLVSNESKVLADIEEALKRIEDKSFGICKSCGKLISKTRLNAIPYTIYCIDCQDKFEKNKLL
ncbi:MAG: TraR/DksA C4-type zinc finger protein [Candidatus Omnitrophica bacterium]|nr:TraR/DksA C4-type zinc finger protein [Candidatus Omnitrophota bacterium]